MNSQFVPELQLTGSTSIGEPAGQPLQPLGLLGDVPQCQGPGVLFLLSMFGLGSKDVCEDSFCVFDSLSIFVPCCIIQSLTIWSNKVNTHCHKVDMHCSKVKKRSLFSHMVIGITEDCTVPEIMI